MINVDCEYKIKEDIEFIIESEKATNLLYILSDTPSII